MWSVLFTPLFSVKPAVIDNALCLVRIFVFQQYLARNELPASLLDWNRTDRIWVVAKRAFCGAGSRNTVARAIQSLRIENLIYTFGAQNTCAMQND
jgi:hypothetical protein